MKKLKMKDKNDIVLKNNEIQRPFYTAYTKYANGFIESSKQHYRIYTSQLFFMDSVYRAISAVYGRMLYELHLDGKESLVNFVDIVSSDVLNYISRLFNFYFNNNDIILDAIKEEVETKTRRNYDDLTSTQQLPYIREYVNRFIYPFVNECTIYMANSMYNVLYKILIVELNSDDFKVITELITPILKDFSNDLKEALIYAITLCYTNINN